MLDGPHDAGVAAAEGPAVLMGSQHLKTAASKQHSSTSWVVTACLVPDGLPTAAAAETDGGLACLEIVCRVLVLQDCQPTAASPGLTKALAKGGANGWV